MRELQAEAQLATGAPPVAITLLGPPQVTVQGHPLTLVRRQARAVLYRLAAAARPVPRDQLAFLLWPDLPDDAARRNLTVLLSQLRQVLPPATLVSGSAGVALDPARVQVDTAAAAGLAARGLRERSLGPLAAAAELYRGPFLDGVALPDAEEFERWLAQERQAWERWHLDLLSALVDGAAASGEYAAAIVWARRGLEADPLAEELHRRLIELHAALGDRVAALRQFEQCVVVLERELGVPPLPATRAAYEAVRDGMAAPKGDVPGLAGPQLILAAPPAVGARSSGEGPWPAAMPTPANPLIGRAREVATLLDLLGREDLRLLTLTGPGGSGKTRLALEVLAQVAPHFPDGVIFVPLAPLHDPSLLLDAIARECGVQGAGAPCIAAALTSALAGRRVLLALDNLEHLLPAVPRLAELLRALPELHLLVTSRSVLRLSGEQVFPVPPLPVPDLASLPPPDELAEQPTVALLLARTRALNPSFALTADNAADLAAICARLDGLPLALELAAARLRLLTPRALLKRLDHRLALLTEGPRDMPERQRSLRAVMAWSYELLDHRERLLFERLAVFAGSWPLDAAEQLLADPEHSSQAAGNVLDGLAALVDASLVQQTIGLDGEPRLQLLETVRAFARERLEARGTAEATADRHLRLYVARAAEAAPRLRTLDAPRWLDRMEDDEPNLLVALKRACACGDEGAVLRLFSALLLFWDYRGHLHEGHHWIEKAFPVLDVPSAAVPFGDASGMSKADAQRLPLAERALRARTQGDAGNLLFSKGEYQAASRMFEAGIAGWRLLDDPDVYAASYAQALGPLWVISELSGDRGRAAALLAEIEALVTRTGDPGAQAQRELAYGLRARVSGKPQEAHDHLRAALSFYRQGSELELLAVTLLNLTLVLLVVGDETAAEAHGAEVLALARSMKSPPMIAHALNDLGEIARYRGADQLAEAHYGESLRLLQRMGNRTQLPRVIHNLGYLALRQGALEHAGAQFGESLRLFAAQHVERGMLEGLVAFGALATALGRPLLAARLWGAAEALGGPPGLDLWPPDQLAYAEALARARAASAAEAFRASWQAGRGLSWPEALALAESVGQAGASS